MTKAFTLQDLGLTRPDAGGPIEFLADLAAHRLGVEAAVVSFLEDSGTVFACRLAGPDGPSGFRRIPAAVLPGAQVVESRATVALSRVDARSPAGARLHSYGFAAYLGHPIFGPADDPVGVVAALSRRPRIWSAEDRRLLAGVAELAGSQVLLRASLETVARLGAELRRRPKD